MDPNDLEKFMPELFAYRFRVDGDEELVVAPTMERALEMWGAHMRQEGLDPADCEGVDYVGCVAVVENIENLRKVK